MKYWILLIAAIFSVFSCSSKQAPAWQQDSYVSMENYISNYLTGNLKFAERHFEKMVDALKMTTDPDEVVKAYLLKCSLEKATFVESGCEELQEYFPLLQDPVNIKLFYFLSGASKSSDDVPERYRKVYEAVTGRCDTGALNPLLKSEKNHIAVMVSTAYAVKNGCYDAETITISLKTVSKNGWFVPAVKYLAILQNYYDRNGDAKNRDLIKKRLELMLKRDNREY